MSRKFLTAIDLTKNELQNAVVQNLGSAPSSPVKGQLYFNSTGGDNTLYWWDGTTWVPAKASASVPLANSASSLVPGNAMAGGAATDASRGDHVHGLPGFGAVTAQVNFSLGSTDGTAGTFARSDHAHGTPAHDHSGLMGPVTAEPSFGSASANGVSTLLSRADHAHGNPTHDAAAHSTIPLSALAPATANLNLGGFKITNLGAPTAFNDATTKQYVDGLAQGVDAKQSVRAATTANIANFSTPPATIDGVTMNTGDRVLVKNQTSPADNGIYTWDLGMMRTTDADAWTELVSAYVFVESGTTQADTGWLCTVDPGGTLGTTAVPWVQFSAAGAYTAGAGMTQTGSTFNVIAGDTSLTVAADDVRVNTSVIATVASLAGYVPTARTLTAGAGLTGGGDLSANRTLDVGAGTGITVAADTVALDKTYTDGLYAPLASASKRYAANVGGATSATVAHNLNTRDVQVQVYRVASPYDTIDCDVERTDVNNVTLRFTVAPAASEYRAVVLA